MVDLNNKTILVTGGCGFIGSNFIEKCFKEFPTVKVINVDKLGVGSRTDVGVRKGDYTFIQDDIAEGHVWQTRTVNEDLDYVFHFAAESHVDRSIYHPSHFISNNVLGTSYLLEYIFNFHPKTKVVCISTDEVYGHLGLDDAPFTIDTILAPRSPYAASKAASDLVALAYATTYDLSLALTRCCNNFGPNQHDEKFIPTVIRHLLKDEEIPVYGTGENIREWIYVDDHNDTILKIADKVGYSQHVNNIWNIGTGIEMSNLDMIDIISNLMGKTPKIKFVEDRKAHDFRYAIENNSLLDWNITPFDDAMNVTIEHFTKKYGTV